MKFEIVDSIPARTGGRGPISEYVPVIGIALRGKTVRIPVGDAKSALRVRGAIAALIRVRKLPLRVASRGVDVYLERKDV